MLNAETAGPYTKELEYSDYNPKDLNPEGGQEVIVEGDGFPWITPGDFECIVGGQSVPFELWTNTKVRCTTPHSDDMSEDGVAIMYGEETTGTDDPVTTSDDVFIINSMDLDNALPGKKTDLIIQGEGFGTDPYALKCRMQPLAEENQVYRCSVWKAADTEVTVVLAGGKLGTYRIILTKEGWGDNAILSEGVDQLDYRL